MKKFHLWRFGSNPETIIHKISPTMVQIVWSRSFSFGGNMSFCYRCEKENDPNLIPLTDAEAEEIVAKRKERGLDINIGTIP